MFALEGLQHIADDGVGELAGYAADGVPVLLDEAAEVLGGLELLAVEDGGVAVEDVAVVGGEDDFGGDGDEIAGGFAGGSVVGEGGDGLGEDGAVKGGVGVGGVGVSPGESERGPPGRLAGGVETSPSSTRSNPVRIFASVRKKP